MVVDCPAARWCLTRHCACAHLAVGLLLIVWVLGAAGPRCSRMGPLLFPFPECLVASFSAAPSLVCPLRKFWWLPVTPSVCLHAFWFPLVPLGRPLFPPSASSGGSMLPPLSASVTPARSLPDLIELCWPPVTLLYLTLVACLIPLTLGPTFQPHNL